jgi:hypothetical protein
MWSRTARACRLARGFDRIVLDLNEVDFIDSTRVRSSTTARACLYRALSRARGGLECEVAPGRVW